jgi:hypothetical protein
MATPQKTVSGPSQFSPEKVASMMKIPPQFQAAYQRVILAGRKIMYSDQMSQQIAQLMQGQGSVGEKIGHGVVALISIILEKSNGTMPPQIIMPAGAELIAEAGDLLHKGGVPVTDKDLAQAMSVYVQEIMQRAKEAQAKKAQAGPQGQPPQPTAAPQPPAAPQPAQPAAPAMGA